MSEIQGAQNVESTAVQTPPRVINLPHKRRFRQAYADCRRSVPVRVVASLHWELATVILVPDRNGRFDVGRGWSRRYTTLS